MNEKTFVGLPGVYRAKVIKNLKKVEIKDAITEEVVKKHIESPGDIVDLCCEHFEVQKKDLLGPVRKKGIVRPRQMCIAVIRMLFPNETLKNIGRIFGRDHSTVIHTVAVVQDYIDTDPSYRYDYHSFLKRL